LLIWALQKLPSGNRLLHKLDLLSSIVWKRIAQRSRRRISPASNTAEVLTRSNLTAAAIPRGLPYNRESLLLIPHAQR
jgi:hypothetical protein